MEVAIQGLAGFLWRAVAAAVGLKLVQVAVFPVEDSLNDAVQAVQRQVARNLHAAPNDRFELDEGDG
jgi:hypothetical protein